jgi:hypothetical protein
LTGDDSANGANASSPADCTIEQARNGIEKCLKANPAIRGLPDEEAGKSHALILSVREPMQQYRATLLCVYRMGSSAKHRARRHRFGMRGDSSTQR